jgi:PAS domain S-box-containing protein
MNETSMKTDDRSQTETSDIAAPRVNDLFDSVDLAKAIDTEEFKYFLDHIPVALVISKRIRGEHRIVYANAAFENKTGRPLADMQGRSWSVLDDFRHEDDPGLTIGKALLMGEDFLGLFRLETPQPITLEVYASVIQNEDGTENYRLAVLVDITERERFQREKLTRQIRDKDLLLREIQHRVKNNLQLIAVLIRLEARSERLGEQVNLERLAGRIESLQFLYNALSDRPPGESIDLGSYLSQIASGVMSSHSVEGIKFAQRVENAPVSINIAMSVGLIVNELLTNAFKYAFPGRQAGTITLECLHKGADRYCIVVADDGVGFPPGVTWPMEGKLSSLIVQTLRENAKTELEVRSSGAGTTITLCIVHTPPRLASSS